MAQTSIVKGERSFELVQHTVVWTFDENLTILIGGMSLYIGVGRFRMLGGGQDLEYLGAKGGSNSQQAHDVVTTSHRRHVPTRFLINQCQIITFLILKSDNIENSRIELKGIVLQVRSSQSYIYYYFTLQLGTFVIFSCFT